jgi:hypothetical protein
MLGTGGYLMTIGVLLTVVVVPVLAGERAPDKWRYPKTVAVLLWISGGADRLCGGSGAGLTCIRVGRRLPRGAGSVCGPTEG